MKIDRAFVNMLGESEGDRALTETVINLARSRKLKVVAEGVETSEQVRLLLAMGCEAMQGFHFARAMSAEQFDLWLKEYKPPQATAD